MKKLPDTEYIKIRRSKLQGFYKGAKENCSAKYFDFIRSFYYDLYCCAFAMIYKVYAEGEDKVYYCRKSDIEAVFKKYRDNSPKYKNWRFWLECDFGISSYYVPCDDADVTNIKAFFERGNNNGKQN